MSGSGTGPLTTQPPGPPPGLGEIAERVEARLAGLLAEERTRWAGVDPDLDEPLAALEAVVLSGGKRLRPAFCLWGWVAAGGDPDDGASRAAVDDLGAAFELLHAFALVHDDVMDGADTRRGLRTTHVTFSDRHRTASWRGESRRFGESVAILVGDLAHVYATALVTSAPLATTALWRQMQVELVAGQYLDVLRTAHGEADAVQARLIARLKSGRYSIEQPLRLGASLRVASPELDAALVAYGEPLGMAFQLRDDVLGVVGDPQLTGKPVGADLREGKPTPLLALARARATPAQAALLEQVGHPDLGDDDVVALRDLLVATGALDEIEREIDELTARAIASLDGGAIPAHARDGLGDLARFVASRTH